MVAAVAAGTGAAGVAHRMGGRGAGRCQASRPRPGAFTRHEPPGHSQIPRSCHGGGFGQEVPAQERVYTEALTGERPGPAVTAGTPCMGTRARTANLPSLRVGNTFFRDSYAGSVGGRGFVVANGWTSIIELRPGRRQRG